MRRTASVALTFLVSGLCAAQVASIAWDAPVACNAAGEGALRPRIALNGNGDPVVLWGDNMPMANHVSIGTGGVFGPSVQLSAGFMPSVDDWMGSSIASWGNTLWVVMKAMPEESEPLYVRRSDDGGFTWGDTLRVEPFDGLVSRYPSIDLAGPDAPLVQYMQFDNGWNGARQVVAHLMDGAFMDPVQVSAPFAPGEVCDCCPNQIVADGDRAVALYRNAGPNIRVMWGAASTDGGMSFPVGAQVDTTGWALNACPSSGPDGYMAGDSLRYVWMSGANSGAKVYIGSALASDLSLGRQLKVYGVQTSGVQQNFPRIAGSGDTLGVAWQQNVGSNQEILFSWSVSGPDGLERPDTVNLTLSGAQQTPDIAYADGAFHLVWSEPGTGQVWYRKGILIRAVGIAEGQGVDPVSSWPNPVDDLLQVEGTRWDQAALFDALGKLVATLPVTAGTIDMSTLGPGSYAIHLSGRDGAKALLRVQKSR